MAEKTATLPTVAVEPEIYEAVEALAKADDVSRGHIVRQAVREYLVNRGALPDPTAQPARKRSAKATPK